MTELNLIYGTDNNDMNNDLLYNKQDNPKRDALYQNMIKDDVPKISGQQIHQIASQESGINQNHIQQAQQMQQVQQMQQIQQMQPIPPIQQPHMINNQKPKMSYEYTFWDRMSFKRADVIKLAMFSLVIVLGIALDRIGTHYITKYINENILTDIQEFLLRLSYPVLIFLILWILKSI
jgi:hypothetical protein